MTFTIVHIDKETLTYEQRIINNKMVVFKMFTNGKMTFNDMFYP